MAGNGAYFNDDVVAGGICFGAKNIYFVNAGAPQVAQDLANEHMLNKFLAATGVETVRFGHGG